MRHLSLILLTSLLPASALADGRLLTARDLTADQTYLYDGTCSMCTVDHLTRKAESGTSSSSCEASGLQLGEASSSVDLRCDEDIKAELIITIYPVDDEPYRVDFGAVNLEADTTHRALFGGVSIAAGDIDSVDIELR